MSTYVYLECLDHDPPLSSDGEVGQHLYDLPDIRKMIEQRAFYCDLMSRDLPVSFDHHFTSNGARFLAQHPRCRIGICDEYGKKYSIEATQREYAKGGLIEGPSDRDLVAEILAKTSGCPTLSASDVRRLGQLDKLPFRYPDCECGDTETVHSPDGGSCGDCDECHEYRPVEF